MENNMKNYKLAIIHNSDSDDNLGQLIEYVGSDFDKIHSELLLDYAEKHYKDINVFKQLNYRHTPETIGFFMLKIFNNVIFFNTTKNVNKYGYTGNFLMPDDISEVQRDLLYEFVDSIEYYRVNILHSLRLEDGILINETMYCGDSDTPRDMLDRYFKLKDKNLDNKGRR